MSVSVVALLFVSAVTAPLDFTLTPSADGWQLVRISFPFPAGALREGEGLVVSDGHQQIISAIRVLTWHPKRNSEKPSARRALVTFPYEFSDRRPVAFHLEAMSRAPIPSGRFPVEITLNDSAFRIAYRNGPTVTAHLLAPERTAKTEPVVETVESNAHFLWKRFRFTDSQWPRVVELKVDSLGGVVFVAHLQRTMAGDAYAPELGWEIRSTSAANRLEPRGPLGKSEESPLTHSFVTGIPSVFRFQEEQFRIEHPAAPFQKRGHVEIRKDASGFVYRYLRCTPKDKVPMQQTAWRRAEVVIAPAKLAPLTPLLEYAHEEQVSWRLWDELYETDEPLDLSRQPELAQLLNYHHDAIVHSIAHGDDWGNITGYNDGSMTGPPFGMNRLNHAPAIFEEAWRSGNGKLRDVAVNWCDNFHDLSIWWGAEGFGGTRYNNLRAMNQKPLGDDNHFMWRSNTAVDFCTKGYCSFLLAYEETGDPQLYEALEAQVRYASQFVHCDRGEARNIGDVDDFMRLYRYTGEQRFLDQALRLFREVRTKLSPGNLFSQGGKPIEENPPFIDDDDAGYRHPFAKPYIIGYALLGLPRLARVAPDEPKLRGVIQAVADFQAESQDPVGGWRYPHPRSTQLILNQAIEHAWQLVEADRWLGPQKKHLDAVESVLRQRFQGWKQTGHVLAGVTGWEFATGKIRDHAGVYKLYQHPNDRDFLRDYTEGKLTFGSSPPEGLIYFPGVLAFYLKHRSAEHLLAPPRDDEPLGKLLRKVKVTSGARK